MIDSAERTAHSRGGFHHHGRTPAAWAGSIVAAIAFTLGAIGFLISNWTLVWISAVLLVLALVAAGVLRRMGYGQSNS